MRGMPEARSEGKRILYVLADEPLIYCHRRHFPEAVTFLKESGYSNVEFFEKRCAWERKIKNKNQPTILAHNNSA